MSRRLPGAALLPAAAILLAAPPALGYVRSTTASGLCLWWSTRQVHYAVNDFSVDPAASVCSSSPTPPGHAAAAMAAVGASFATWSGAGGCTDLQAVEDGPVASTATGLDCQNLVVFRRGLCSNLVPAGDPCRLWDVNGGATVNCADRYNCWDTDDPSHASDRIIALTTVSYVGSTGEIVDADMELNAWAIGSGPQAPVGSGYYFTCLNPPAPTCSISSTAQTGCIAMDVQNVATHEAGHVLGLGHSPIATATMYASAPMGETSKRTLDPDDVNGICAVYPASQLTNTGPQTGVCSGSGPVALRASSACRQPSSGCGCGTAGAEGWLGLVGLLVRRRGRGKPSP